MLEAFQGRRAFLIKEGEVNRELNLSRSPSHTVQCDLVGPKSLTIKISRKRVLWISTA